MVTMDTAWTVAYRRPRANHFKRVGGLGLSWNEARELAAEIMAPLNRAVGVQVWCVTTAEAEAAGRCCEEDRGNIMVDNGRRVQIRETGSLDEVLAIVAELQQAEESLYVF